MWAKMAVNYTNKTQFVYRINKGVLDISNNTDVNASTPENERRVFFNNMIYLGDGLTDVPCMKLVKLSGGHSIALYQDGQKRRFSPSSNTREWTGFSKPTTERANRLTK